MLTLGIDENQLRKLKKSLNDKASKLPREAAIAVNATVKKVKSEVNKEIRTELAVTKKAVDRSLRIRNKATPTSISATVTLGKSRRIPLKEFGARQGRKGVSYRISKTAGRKTAQGAFQGPRPGTMKVSWRGNVFRRVGKARLPIVKLYGPSPWGVFVKRSMKSKVVAIASEELTKQIERRIRFNLLKSQRKA